MTADKEYDVGLSDALRFIRKHLPVTEKPHGERFFVRQPDVATGKPKVWVTPLFLALAMVEIVNVVFAVDSVPAIFAIKTNPFIVYTSNIFAILGLRALYFALAAMVHRFHYLKYALAVLLVLSARRYSSPMRLDWQRSHLWPHCRSRSQFLRRALAGHSGKRKELNQRKRARRDTERPGQMRCWRFSSSPAKSGTKSQ